MVHKEAENVFVAAAGLSLSITTFALSTNAIWPLVTLPHFEVNGAHANKVSSSLLTIFAPLVSASDPKARQEWEDYSSKNLGWIREGVELNFELHQDLIEGNTFEAGPVPKEIFRFDDGKPIPEAYDGPFLPVWEVAPAPHDARVVKYNLLSHAVFSNMYDTVLETGQPAVSQITSLDFLYEGSIGDSKSHIQSFLLQPVYRKFNTEHDKKNVAGFIVSILSWDKYFENVMENEENSIVVVLENTCNQTFTYNVIGSNVEYVGPGDHHDVKYDDNVLTSQFAPFSSLNNSAVNPRRCQFSLNLYPTRQFEDNYKTNSPAILVVTVLLVFFATFVLFLVYDYAAQRRQNKVLVAAQRSNAIVSSLFPSNVRDRILDGHVDSQDKGIRTAAKSQLKNFIDDGAEGSAGVFGTKPIADLFPNATVMFADIVGFTAWSSVREPCQVFQLLETIYHAFDEHAKLRRVFKVETIGDCYVAVTGLPEPREDHAVAMARFARDCMTKMNDLSKKLETSLGPDTGDLCMRIGLNSGPVTAGVLRGEKSRFQLFGDTVNTAARMESNGERNRIHASQETVDYLRAAGKAHWAKPREEMIVAKGKGKLQTYWIEGRGQTTSVKSGSMEDTDQNTELDEKEVLGPKKLHDEKKLLDSNKEGERQRVQRTSRKSMKEHVSESKPKQLFTDKVERLVTWNADVLKRLLKQIIARRNAEIEAGGRTAEAENPELKLETAVEGSIVLDEVREIIKLPRFDARAAKQQVNPNKIELSSEVTMQLHDYVTVIATLYRDNPFHNFEHASHVIMSVTKLLSRIVAPDEVLDKEDEDDRHLEKNLHDHTYGITSDPLTQFAVVLSALIHDVDHQGVPNAQLVKENLTLASLYRNKSVAEQNSVDIAWDVLMDESFDDLRAVIFTNQAELKRFRQLIVNTVMATDIVDKELKDLRNDRWDKAFQEKPESEKLTREDVNRKATIVIEHLIQASDVSHTMQHWHIYRKWNERFFQENLHAYKRGRASKDPSEFWYKGEIGFFDFYIIPLAKKLKECGVFGVSCDEYLNYANANRKEWELKGESVVAEMVEKYKDEEFEYDGDQCKLGDTNN